MSENIAKILTSIGRDKLRELLVEWDNYRYKMKNRQKDARHDDFMDEITKSIEIDHGLGKCMENNCQRFATRDYNGCGHFVCDNHFDSLSRYFDEEYR